MIRKFLLPLLCVVLFAAPAAHATIYYVDGSKANNNGDGKSWANAKKDVQAAINATTLNGDEVWVKAGTYLPTLNPDGGPSSSTVSQDKAFYVAVFNIKLYGGFPNTTSPAFSDRNPVTNVTTLSGDLDGPGGTADAYHVLVTDGRTAACVVDGFTITGGRANNTGMTFFYYNGNINNGGSFYQYRGGGVYNNESSPTISNCVITGNNALYDGGGMHNAYGTPALSNCTFSNNNSDRGGGMSTVSTISSQAAGGQMTVNSCIFSNNTGSGIDNNTTNLTLINCNFTNNSSGSTVISGVGGGVRNYYGNLTVTNCTFSNNTVTGGSAEGGAIDNSSQYGHNSFVAISNCTFSTNSSASVGGAVSLGSNTFSTIDSSTFTGNTAGNLGGGVFANATASYNGYVGPYYGSCVTSNCTFSGNSASSGGGFYFRGFDNFFAFVNLSRSSFNGNSATQNGGGLAGTVGDTLTVDNCTFSGNTAGNNGGGFFSEIGSPTIKSCTFTTNSAGQSGGGLFELNSARVTNCILSGNMAGVAADKDIRSSPEPVTYSLIGPGNTNYVVGVGITTGSPAFVNSASPAGLDGIFRTADDGLRIGCTSAARDAGTATTPTTDILGNPRVGTPDMGAYENPGTGCTNLIQYVDASMPANGNGYSWGSAKRDLQEALDSVAAGGEVWVKAGTYLPTRDPNGNATPTDARNKTFFLTSKDVKVYGGFSGTETTLSQRNAATNLTILSGDLDGAAGTADAYHVFLTNNRTAATVISGFTISGGRATGSSTISVSGTAFGQASGGGITNSGGSPIIENCIVSSNIGTDYAGGMLNASSSPTIRTCLFSANTGGKGGAITNLGSSNPVISSSTFSANTASVYTGGIYTTNSSGGSITNTILSGNIGGPLGQQNLYKDGASGTLTVSYTFVGDYNATVTNNYTATNILTGDPFVEAGNPAGADNRLGTTDDGLRLNCASPARDAGTGITPATDILGNSRVGTIDIGAYEFQGTTCPTRIYVNGTRPDNSGTGETWATAKKSVQAAINEVSAGGEVWVQSGTYLPTQDPSGNPTPVDARDKTFYLTTKDVKLYGGFAGTEMTLSQRISGANTTILSGDLDGTAGVNDAYHVLITSGRTVACIVDRFTITGGRANGNGTLSASGTAFDRTKAGGMYNINDSLTITSCIFGSNTAIGDGGGMYNKSANPRIASCTYSTNLAGAGGAIYNSLANPTIDGCTFANNTATQSGGGLYNYSSSPQLDSCSFTANAAATNGGGIYTGIGSPIVRKSVFRANTATGSGGGMYDSSASPAIITCVFNANTAGGNGGGIHNNNSNLTITNCIFATNTANQNGGALSNINNSNGSVSSTTFGTNTATQNGGGIYSDATSGGTLTNAILSGNTGGPANRQNIYKDAGSGTLTLSYTLVGDYSSTATNNYTGSNILTGDPFVDGSNPTGADTRLGTADDGLRLNCASVARDAGTGTTPTTDILGNGRIGTIDIGAYEFQGTTCPTQLYVNSARPDNSGTGTNWANAKRDLQAAINEVASGGSVWVQAGTYLPTLDPTGNPTPADARDKTFYLLGKDVKLYGGFSGNETQLVNRNVANNVTILSGDLDGTNGTADAYHVLIASGRTDATTVDGFTIRGGRATGSGTATFSGTAFDRSKAGGMYNLNGKPSVAGCTFTANTATGAGGGIYTKNGTPAFGNCIVINNAAGSGGGMYISTTTSTLTSCMFSNNTATQNGGGIYNDTSTTTVTTCTFSNNNATLGGGVYNTFSNAIISSATFGSNTATTSGGGIYNLSSNPSITGSNFNTNTATISGGGIYNLNSSPSVTGSNFSANTATVSGGGTYNEGGNLTFTRCTFSGNTTSGNGGGIYNLATSPTTSNCSFNANTATQNGGAMYNNTGANPAITNCTFSNNAGLNGGGMYNASASPVISSSTFSANTATQNGGSIYSDATSGGNIVNTILSGSTGTSANRQNLYKDAGSGTLTVSYSVVSDYSAGAANNYTASNIAAGDAQFVNAASPAGADGLFRTADDGLRLNCASPARNMGVGSTPATDILGNSRVGFIDIGAYENPGTGCPKTLYVDGTKTNNNGSGLDWANAKKDLQEAINAAIAGDEIWIKGGTYLPTRDPNGSATPTDPRDKAFYLIGKDVKLYGGFAGTETFLSQRNTTTNVTTLSGDLDGTGGTNDAYHVMLTRNLTATSVMDGFTISGGRANNTVSVVFSGITFQRNHGGGIYNTGSSPIIRNCVISSNIAVGDGGGMYNLSSSSPQISNCTFSSNTAGIRGGGLLNTGGSPAVSGSFFTGNTSGLNGGGLANVSSSTVSVSRCSFNANSAGQNGGGLSNGANSTLSISNCVFSVNTANNNGGGLANVNSGILTLSNCTFSGNAADTAGGGMFNSNNSRGTVTNCILSGNTGGPLYRQNLFKDTGSTTLTVRYSIINDYSDTATNNYTADTGLIAADPLFVNPSNPSGADGILGTADDGLTLQSCSPALNAGTTPASALPQDLLNKDRVGAYDLGAYEYQSAPTAPVLAGITTTTNRMQYRGGVTVFGDCSNTIGMLRSAGAKPVNGTVAATAYVQSTTLLQGLTPFVRRHYDLTPATGADTATALVTLYFNQADFDDYNTNRGNQSLLPVDATDAAGYKSNLRITQEHGTSTTGLPGSYSGWSGTGPATVTITPQSVTWNAPAARWEVTVPITGFSGFFANTTPSTSLPVTLVSFNARPITASSNRLEWTTASEEAGTQFTAERSGDAKTFTTLAIVTGRGFATGSDYQLEDQMPLEGDNYYRLKVQAPTGATRYSQTVRIQRGSQPTVVAGVTVYPNPAQDWVTIQCTDEALLGTTAVVVDLNGRTMQELVLTRDARMDIRSWAAGVYVLRLPSGHSIRIIKQ